jgi:type II secretory ATPase GspE/PulE/Tfp pilus assembly ATPase PilB-like protein
LTKNEKEQGTIDLVDTMLQYAQQNGASDIHFDPVDGGAMLRYRIDGILHDILKINAEFADLIVSRVKILSKMRTDEHRSAQDGKLSFSVMDYGLTAKKTAKKKIDVRVSVMPTVHGENLVMRLLTSDNRSLTLDDLGFSSKDAQTIRKAIKNPVGMILVAGPTGSGKTTTLYGILKILNKREINIATIEDPIEYSIEGITQIQVNAKTNLNFASGLRAIVRQDPNIIMVGEIRDHETADIAVNSAMTGHLVLSTLHANNSATTLPRLLDMGIEPFLVASTMNIIIAQRLVRKVCENCRASYHLTKEDKKALEAQPKVFEAVLNRSGNDLDSVRLYRGAGCKVCEQTGYVGRIGIFEILEMSPEIKEAILKRLSSDEIVKIAVAQGMTTMLVDGVDKAWQGITTVQEVLRVASSD